MPEVEFKTSDHPNFGRKLLVQFDYDRQKINAIKSLNWSNTHRSFNKGDDPESPFDTDCWHIDCTADAITQLEQALNTRVPSEFKPQQQDTGSVEIRIPESRSKFYVDTTNPRIHDILAREMSYVDPDAEYTEAYKRGEWDGTVYIYEAYDKSGPVGLVDRAERVLTEEGYDVTVTWEARNKGADICVDWRFEHELRGYQKEAIAGVIANQGRGIIGLPTGAGKTVTALNLISRIQNQTLVFVHTQELLYQWADEIRDNLGIEPGIIGDGEWSEGPVTVTTMQSMLSKGTAQLEGDYGVLVFDECHRTSAADQFHEVGMDLDAYYRIGLSATPWRKVSGEEMKIEGAVGGMAHTVTAESLIEQGYLAEPEFDVLKPSEYGQAAKAGRGDKYHEAMEKVVELDPIRHQAIAEKAADLAADGHKVLINVNRVAQGYITKAALNKEISSVDIAPKVDSKKRSKAVSVADMVGTVADCGAEMLDSSVSNTERKEMLDRFDSGETMVLVSTLVKEGVDIPSISAIILAHGQKSDTETVQTIGRALRPDDDKKAQVVDVADKGRYFADAHKERMETMDEYYGSYGPQ